MQFYSESVDKVLTELRASEHGLGGYEPKRRLEQYGPNSLQTESKVNPIIIFFNQFKSFIVYILLFAVFFALLIGEYVDSIIILAILLANAFIGFFQELSANKSLEALKKLTTIKAKVERDGKLIMVESENLVPGDIIHLEAGDKVPADARLIEAVRLTVEESALTGESLPIDKNINIISDNVQIGEQRNMLFSSTSVAKGTAKAVVTKTGMNTEIGKITKLIKEAEEEMTPLQRRLDSFGKKLGYVIIAICLVIFIASFVKDYFTIGLNLESFIAFAFIAISLAVAAVPTALPAVVTIALSIGVKRLLKKKALVRHLSSVETLGSCDVICTDKTGTLTQNQMTVRKVWNFDGSADVSGAGYSPVGGVSTKMSPLLFEIGHVCNNASLYQNEKSHQWEITGDPTEAALLVSAAKAGVDIEYVRHDEIPFDSDRKLMSVLVKRSKKLVMYTKGAPDNVLKACSHAIINGKKVLLTSVMKKKIIKKNDEYASNALRVLAFAYRDVSKKEDFSEKCLVFVGLQAMIDPPRPDVIESIKRTKDAGIRVIMITGDYKETAKAIAHEIGISGDVLTGPEIEKMSDLQLTAALKVNTNIFARVIPEHKQRIVTVLQKFDHTVAMTGDGVNDAPALKKANIGVAVGSGTDVAKEASDFVLLDDSFTHIVNAIEEGRGIYDNIQKSIMLLLSGNLGEVLIIFLAVIFGLNLPLTAILLLWINLVTDGAPALAYSVDPYSKDIMKRKPKPAKEGILPASHLTLISFLGIIGTTIALYLFSKFGGSTEAGLTLAQTMVFNFVVLYELILVFIIRIGYHSPFFKNKWIWFSALLSISAQALIMYTPLRPFFKVEALTLPYIYVLLLGGVIFTAAYAIYHYVIQPRIFSKDITV